MAANKKPEKKKRTTLAFRDDLAKRHVLRAISERRGHADISETLREATDEYIDNHREELLRAA
jgi:hypothetical protein